MEILVLADDMSGALEVGAKFAGRGIDSVVMTTPSSEDATVVVIDTETRHLSGPKAAEVIYRWTGYSPRLIIKKTDSTLRGNIAAELGALARAYPEWRIAFVPAYPALGRTVRDGRLYVDGVPVHLTSFARDPLNPVTDGRISHVLGKAVECDVFDAETDSDIDGAVNRILADSRYRIIAGAAAVADAVASRIDVDRGHPSMLPLICRCLIVNGSIHEASARQIEFARQHGCASTADGAAWKLFERIVPAGAAPLEVARDTSQLVRGALRGIEYDALVVFGGDTAFWILKEFGSPALRPIGEILTGVPVSAVSGSNLYLITKAGGFGEADVICRIKDALHGCNQ